MQNITNLLYSLMFSYRMSVFSLFFLTLFRKGSAHDSNRHFHDDHQINTVLLVLYELAFLCERRDFFTWWWASSEWSGEKQKGSTNLNPLSFAFDTIITKDFQTCFYGIKSYKCDVIKWLFVGLVDGICVVSRVRIYENLKRFSFQSNLWFHWWTYPHPVQSSHAGRSSIIR